MAHPQDALKNLKKTFFGGLFRIFDVFQGVCLGGPFWVVLSNFRVSLGPGDFGSRTGALKSNTIIIIRIIVITLLILIFLFQCHRGQTRHIHERITQIHMNVNVIC